MKLFHTFVIILIQSLSSVQFFVAPMDYSMPGSSISGSLIEYIH